MNRETIIQIAREAGLAEVTDTAESLPADYVEALAKLCALPHISTCIQVK